MSMSNKQSCSDPRVLVKDLGSKDGRVRVRARKNLVKIGHPAVKYLIEALKDRNQVVRWEAAKSMGEIEDPAAVDALVTALRDKMFDVRWLAAQALIQIGSKSIKPILHALIEHPEDDDVRVGAHHVFHDLRTRDYDDVLRPVMVSLEDSTLKLGIDLEAKKVLDQLQK
ncbi:MAG: HEAT repeat domain-containing protein [Dehalococcoidia bacterium]